MASCRVLLAMLTAALVATAVPASPAAAQVQLDGPGTAERGAWPPAPPQQQTHGAGQRRPVPATVGDGAPAAVGPHRAEPLPVAPGGAAVRYRPPHPGPVLRPFEAPATSWGPGHRGVDLEVAAGDEVVAAAAGSVTWADRTAGLVWVTLLHADGIRTSYGPFASLDVAAGDAVRPGQVLGQLAAGGHGAGSRDRGLHWSARRPDGSYLDPLTLLAGGTPRPTLVGPGGWWGSDPVVEPYARWQGRVRYGVFVEASPPATRAGYAVAPNWHHLVVVPGLNSRGAPPLEPAFLGYDAGSRSVFSYTGCEPTPGGCVPRPYAPVDTHHGVERAARDLEHLLRELQRAQPGRPVDLVGHSQGGLVASHYLRHRHDPLDPGLPPVANLVTYASPFGGAPLANLLDSAGQNLLGWGPELLLRGIDRLSGWPAVGGLRLTSPSIRDAKVSTFGRALGVDAGPDPPPTDLGTRIAHLGGSRDLLVPGPRAAPPGQALTYLPGGHHGMVRTEAAHQVAHEVLRGHGPAPVDGWGVGAVPHEVGRLVDDVAGLLDVANLVLGERLPVAPGIPVGVGGQEAWLLPDRDTAGRPTR